jgi:hypothetical protein
MVKMLILLFDDFLRFALLTFFWSVLASMYSSLFMLNSIDYNPLHKKFMQEAWIQDQIGIFGRA